MQARFRHALLMSFIRKKDNPTQGTLQAIFGIDQTSVCRYLKVMDRILASVLRTAKNVSKEIATCKTKEEFKRMVPGPGGGDVTADGTYCPVQRPSEKTVWRMIYSEKKKWFIYVCTQVGDPSRHKTASCLAKSCLGSSGT